MTKSRRMAALAALGAVQLLAACAAKKDGEPAVDTRPAEGVEGQPIGDPGGAPQVTKERVAELESRAKAIAGVDGCTADGECRAAPVGAKPCGGPRYYLAYCARTTDSTALYRALEELRAAEEAYNRSEGMMGTCEYVETPKVALRGKACTTIGP